MKDIIKVLIVEDHLIARIGISTVINSQPDMTVVAEASNGRDGVMLYRQHQPDVTLMDLRLPDIWGTEAIELILNEAPKARIIALTSLDGDGEINSVLRSGGVGYILKDVLDNELIGAIRTVQAGKKYLASKVAASLSAHIYEDALTPGEQRVLEMIVRGQSNKEIAYHLGVKENTVKTHVRNILDKLGVSDRTAAAITAVRRGLIRLDS